MKEFEKEQGIKLAAAAQGQLKKKDEEEKKVVDPAPRRKAAFEEPSAPPKQHVSPSGNRSMKTTSINKRKQTLWQKREAIETYKEEMCDLSDKLAKAEGIRLTDGF